MFSLDILKQWFPPQISFCLDRRPCQPNHIVKFVTLALTAAVRIDECQHTHFMQQTVIDMFYIHIHLFIQ